MTENRVKAVVVINKMENYQSVYQVRVLEVRFVELERTMAFGLYPKFDNKESVWAEQFNWSLYSGSVLVKGQELEVYGWSFNGELPLYWGCDMFDWRPRGDLSAWGWLGSSDDPGKSIWYGPGDQEAAHLIVEKLGEDVYKQYLNLVLDKA